MAEHTPSDDRDDHGVPNWAAGTDAIYLMATFFSERYGQPVMLFMRPTTLERFITADVPPDFSEHTIEQMLELVDFACLLEHDQLHDLIHDLMRHHGEQMLYEARRKAQARFN